MERNAKYIKITLTIVGALLIALSCYIVFIGYRGGHFSSVDRLQAYIQGFGACGPLVLTFIQIIQIIIPVLPGWVGCMAGAVMFGPVLGFLCNYIGICIGSIGSYFLARRYGIRLVEKMVPMDKYKKFITWVNEKKSYSVILFWMILLPLTPDDFLCWFSGLTDMKPKRFIWIILLGKPWVILVYSVVFARLG